MKHVWAAPKKEATEKSTASLPWLTGIAIVVFLFCVGNTMMRVLLALGLILFLAWLLKRKV